jgi:outer membrane protein assembly factor BamB
MAVPAPIVVNNKLVDPDDGRIVAVLPTDVYQVAVPTSPHHYRVGDLDVDAATGATTKIFPAVEIENGSASPSVVRREIDGSVRWTTPLKGVRSVRPPDIVLGPGRVVATVDEALFAFDDATGAPAWKAPGPADRLATDGTLLFTTDCSVHSGPRWLVARRLTDGHEVFRRPLPAKLDPFMTLDDRFVLVVDDHTSLTFDHAGKELFRADETILGSPRAPEFGGVLHPLAGDALLASDKRIARIDASGRVVWRRGPPRDTFVGMDDFVDLPGGDVLLANYGGISDSGVQVLRLRAADGSVVWEARAAALGVAHSQYQHVAYLETRGDVVYVVSQGSYGSFFERIALPTGKREVRCLMQGEAQARCAPP